MDSAQHVTRKAFQSRRTVVHNCGRCGLVVPIRGPHRELDSIVLPGVLLNNICVFSVVVGFLIHTYPVMSVVLFLHSDSNGRAMHERCRTLYKQNGCSMAES